MDLKTIGTKELMLELMRRSKVEVKNLKPKEQFEISTDKEIMVLSIPKDAYEIHETISK